MAVQILDNLTEAYTVGILKAIENKQDSSTGLCRTLQRVLSMKPRSLVLANIDPWQDLRQSIPQNIEWTLHLYTAVVYAAQKTCSLTYLLVWTSSWFPEFAHIPTLSPTFNVLMNSSAIGKFSSLSISF